MMILSEFEEKYSKEIGDLMLSQDEIFCNYQIYAEDPAQFHASMISEDYGQFAKLYHKKMGNINKI